MKKMNKGRASCPASMRKDYKAICKQWIGMAISALAFIALLIAMIVIHNGL